MIVVYYSVTKNIDRFVSKASKVNSNINFVKLNDYDSSFGKFILITPTHGIGSIPSVVSVFLDKYSENLIAVSSSGNKNWGINVFAKSADLISEKYNVPIVNKFELSGFNKDIDLFLERASEIWNGLN